MSNDDDDGGQAGGGADDGNAATWYMLRCKTFREAAGLRKQQLAIAAKVDRSTIDKIEKRTPMTMPTIRRVFNVLNERHGKQLHANKEIVNTLQKRH